MNYKSLGDIGVLGAIGILGKLGVNIALPVTDNLPFDIIVIINNKLFRVQIKSSSHHVMGTVTFGLKTSNPYTGKKTLYDKTMTDAVMFYDLRNNEAYLFHINDVSNKGSITIRLSPSKNKQAKNITHAKDCVVSRDRIKQVFGEEIPKIEQYFSIYDGLAETEELMKRFTKKCTLCGNEFKTNYKYAKFCSLKCNHLSQQRVRRPEKEELKHLIIEKSMVQIGKMFGVSDNAVRKWAKAYGIQIQ